MAAAKPLPPQHDSTDNPGRALGAGLVLELEDDAQPPPSPAVPTRGPMDPGSPPGRSGGMSLRSGEHSAHAHRHTLDSRGENHTGFPERKSERLLVVAAAALALGCALLSSALTAELTGGAPACNEPPNGNHAAADPTAALSLPLPESLYRDNITLALLLEEEALADEAFEGCEGVDPSTP